MNTDKNALQVSTELRNIAELMEIPYIDVYGYNRLFNQQANKNIFSIQIYPNWSQISKAILSLIQEDKWNNIMLLYEKSDGTIIFNTYTNLMVKRIYDQLFF